MTGKRNQNRDAAMEKWLKCGGKITTKELSDEFGVSVQSVRRWKKEDAWQTELDRKKHGGQKGNKNAVGHGAPKGNGNAVTHGAYARVRLEGLSLEEREYLDSLTLEIGDNMLLELRLLYAKERDLMRKIRAYEQANHCELYVDRVVETLKPLADTDGEMYTAVRTVMKSSPFERLMKLEAEYNKTHGRILKLIDSIRACDSDKKRIDLDERKHSLAKQRLSGEFYIDPESGEIDDCNYLEC